MSFDQVAPLYDGLARLVFGKVWKEIQLTGIDELNEHKSILILGGGTGAVLPYLKRDMFVTYVDISARMIEIASRRKTKARVRFVQSDFFEWESTEQFDAIYTPFFLDCFDSVSLLVVVGKVKGLLKSKGILYVLDFQRASALKNFMIHIMYSLFRLFVGLKGDRLLPIPKFLDEKGLSTIFKKKFYRDWIFFSGYSQRP